MKLSRASIAKLMVVVGIVAFDCAAARTLFAYNAEMLIGVALGGVLLQVGTIRLMGSRGRHRAFWGGLVVCGMMAIMSFVWAMLFPEILGIRGGALIRSPGSPLHRIWQGYANFASERVVQPLQYDHRLNSGPRRVSALGVASIVVIRAIIWFLPQLLIALAGGLLAGLIGGRPDKSSARDPKSPAASLPSVARS